MIETSVHPELSARLSRGVALFRERGEEIERTTAHTYRVPSCTGEGSYLVYLDLRACTCPDHPRAKALGARCKHFYAAEIFAAKRTGRSFRPRSGLRGPCPRRGCRRSPATSWSTRTTGSFPA